MGGLLGLAAPLLQTGPGLGQLALNLLQPGAALVNLGGQGSLPALLLLQVRTNTLGRFLIVGNVAL